MSNYDIMFIFGFAVKIHSSVAYRPRAAFLLICSFIFHKGILANIAHKSDLILILTVPRGMKSEPFVQTVSSVSGLLW